MRKPGRQEKSGRFSLNFVAPPIGFYHPLVYIQQQTHLCLERSKPNEKQHSARVTPFPWRFRDQQLLANVYALLRFAGSVVARGFNFLWPMRIRVDAT